MKKYARLFEFSTKFLSCTNEKNYLLQSSCASSFFWLAKRTVLCTCIGKKSIQWKVSTMNEMKIYSILLKKGRWEAEAHGCIVSALNFLFSKNVTKEVGSSVSGQGPFSSYFVTASFSHYSWCVCLFMLTIICSLHRLYALFCTFPFPRTSPGGFSPFFFFCTTTSKCILHGINIFVAYYSWKYKKE